MKVKYLSSYRKGNGTVHVYAVEGTKQEQAAYKATKGEFYRESQDKEPLFFSTVPLAEGTALALKSDKSDYYAKTDLLDQSMQIEETALAVQGKLEGIRRFAGLSKKSFLETTLGALLS